MTVANVKMTRRNRTSLFFSLLFPIMFMVIFGLIFGRAGATKTSVDVVGKGPLVAALRSSKAVQLHPRASEKEALKRVKDGDEDGALVVRGSSATLYYSNTDAIGVIRTAMELKVEVATAANESEARMQESLTLLCRMAASFEVDPH